MKPATSLTTKEIDKLAAESLRRVIGFVRATRRPASGGGLFGGGAVADDRPFIIALSSMIRHVYLSAQMGLTPDQQLRALDDLTLEFVKQGGDSLMHQAGLAPADYVEHGRAFTPIGVLTDARPADADFEGTGVAPKAKGK